MMRKHSMVCISGFLLLLVFCQTGHAEEVNRLTAGKSYYVIESGAFEFDAGVDYAYQSDAVGGFDFKNKLLLGRLSLYYAPADRLNAGIEVPYAYVKMEMDSLYEESENDFGDISCSLQWRLFEESDRIPALVVEGRGIFPTGKDPYSGNPPVIATGTGYYSANAGLYLSKNWSVVLLFGGGFYQYNFDADVYQKRTEGILDEVDPGNQYGFEVGTGYAVHENAAIQIAYSRIETDDFKLSYRNAPEREVRRPSLSLLGAGLGWRFAPDQLLSLKSGFGLDDDSPDLILSLRYAVLF